MNVSVGKTCFGIEREREQERERGLQKKRRKEKMENYVFIIY